MLDEEWREIPGYDNYQVSELGRIRSVEYTYTAKDRWNHTTTYRVKGKLLTPTLNKAGYYSVCLRGNRKLRVNRAVCLAFHGLAPFEGAIVRHLNGNSKDNRYFNVAWGTALDNAQDSIRHGTKAKGSSIGTSKLTEDQVKQIRLRYSRKLKNGVILAKEYGVDNSIIYDIIHRKTWKHII